MKALLRRLKTADADATGTASLLSTSRTHVGRVRRINEDRVLDRPELSFWAVADGMGGQGRGDMAADTLVRCLARLEAPITNDAVTETINLANEQIFELGAGQSGTTLVLLRIKEARATIWWIGDSRGYLIRDGRLKLLTRDHSLVQELVDARLIEAEDAATHPQANVITRAVGIAATAQVESLTFGLHPKDRILLCSDGLSRTLAEPDPSAGMSLADRADNLLRDALDRDGSDNISLVMVEV